MSFSADGNKLCLKAEAEADEFHMHWVQNVKINMAINCENTWYLTATPTRTDNGESRVFRRTMNKIPIYGEKTQTIRNDINLRLIDYNTYPTDYDIQSCMTYKGLSAINYWNYIFNNEKRRLYLLGMIKMVGIFVRKTAFGVKRLRLRMVFCGLRSERIALLRSMPQHGWR